MLYLVMSTAHEFQAFVHAPGAKACVPSYCIELPICWSPPPDGCLKWNLDGSIRNSLGATASGGVLRNTTGQWLLGIARKVGCALVIVAELWAFKDATSLSILRGDSWVCFESDSSITVKFIQHGVDPSHPFFGLVSSILNDIGKFQMSMLIMSIKKEIW
ncbi:Ribonuclease H-like superfamily [Sesbania bispinosa]|nr:Ribonuclease H-like superfamily [Sesbania bispinosa]